MDQKQYIDMAQYTDIPNELLIHPTTNDLVLKTDESAVRQSIKNLINLSVGEKPFHPEIGISIRDLLFENLTPMTVSMVRRNMFTMIETFEPRARVVDVVIGEYPDEGAINLTIIFRLVNSQENTKLDFYFDRVR